MTDTTEFQDELKDSAHKIWLAGLGAMTTAGEEGSKMFKILVEKGEVYESRGRQGFDDVKDNVKDKVEEAAEKAKDVAEKAKEAAEKAKDQAGSTWEKMEEKMDGAVTAALGRLGVPNRDEIATLTQRVEELTAVVEQLKPAEKKKARKTAKPAGD